MKKSTFIKTLASTALIAVATLTLAGCKSTSGSASASSKTISDLKISFVPSKNPDDIVTATKPLGDLLKSQLKKEGYTVNKVDISVGTDYQAVGEALSSGSADVGYGVPGTTYALYKDETDVLLTATRAGLSKDSSNPADWNNGQPTTTTSATATTYRALLLVGPSAKGKELAAKINSGQKLSWNDLSSAKWGLSSTSSAAGYVYPSLWLYNNYQHPISDLKNTVTIDSYGTGFARLASGQIDILPVYADARSDFASAWTTTYGQKTSIWNGSETNVIGVTPAINNDAILTSKNSKIMTPDFKKALSSALIDLAKTPQGKKVIAVYSHTGYQPSSASDYKDAVAAMNLMNKQK